MKDEKRFSSFPLFQSHIDLAHQFWTDLIKPNEIAIDATCGNGHDSLILAKLTTNLYLFDIQEHAIENTRVLLQNNLIYVTICKISKRTVRCQKFKIEI